MKKLLTLLSMLALLLAACGGGSQIDEADAEKYIEKGKEIVHLMNKGKYEEMHEMFNEDMAEELSVADLEELTPIIEDAGNFEEISKASIEEKEELYGVVLVTQYSEEELVFAVSFDDEMEVAGLFIQ